MDKVWCPRCDKGWALRGRVKRTDETVWVCESCRALWEGPLKPEGPATASLASYLTAHGLPADRDEVELLAVRDEE